MPQGSSPSRSYYEILGVNPTATANEIKAAYRKLARTLHPDVNPNDPHASQKFAEVNAAYKILSDTLSRSNYDAEQALNARREQTARARAGGATPSATYATQAPRPGARPNPPPQPPPSSGDEAVRLMNDARAALSRMRFVEARDLAQRSLRMKRSAEGYEVLGDVYRLQGRTEDAINMYTMSLQLNPRNNMVMDRLQRLARGTSSGANRRRYDVRSESSYPSGGNTQPPSYSSAQNSPSDYVARPGSVGAGILPEKRPLLKMFAVVFGYGITFLLLISLAVFMPDAPKGYGPVPIPAISKWSGGLIAVLLGSGIASGWTMSVTGVIRRLEDELIFSRAQSGFIPPMGPVLLVLSAISFWAAAILHLILSALQEARLTGILRVFAAVVSIVILAGIFYDPVGRGQIFLWGGNLVFLSFIFGWFVGDMFRTD